MTSLVDGLEADFNGVSMVVGFSLPPFICGAFMLVGHVACCCSSPGVPSSFSELHTLFCALWKVCPPKACAYLFFVWQMATGGGGLTMSGGILTRQGMGPHTTKPFATDVAGLLRGCQQTPLLTGLAPFLPPGTGKEWEAQGWEEHVIDREVHFGSAASLTGWWKWQSK